MSKKFKYYERKNNIYAIMTNNFDIGYNAQVLVSIPTLELKVKPKRLVLK